MKSIDVIVGDGLRGTGYELRVARSELRLLVSGYRLRFAGKKGIERVA